jgi:hypothetical protein
MDLIRERVASGELPADDWERTRLILGGAIGPCAACDAPTTAENPAVWCERAGRAFVLHPDCYVLWEQAAAEKRARDES